MKFNDEKNLNKNIKTVSPQAAMDDYFDDMFGAAGEDPLKKLESQDESLKPLNFSNPKIKKAAPAKVDSAPKTKRQTQKQTYSLNSPQFDEPDIISKSLSSLIIPAAFPKLAPTKPITEIETKVQVEQVETQEAIYKANNIRQKQSSEPKKSVKTRIDAKTALALLNKQKSKLSPAQKLRLKEKLKSLSNVKQEIHAKPLEASTKTELKNEVQETVVIEQIKPVAKKQELSFPDLKISENQEQLKDKQLNKNKLPDWANQRFECLLFSVAGLKLAVPLISLGAIYKIEKEFIPLVGRANWFMGLYHHLERNVRVIDTAQWVMPERCSNEVRSGYKFIIRLGGNDWGLACDAVHESIQLNPDQIKWRTERTKREWLFGTVIDHMCALIDVTTLSTILEQQASRNPSIFLN